MAFLAHFVVSSVSFGAGAGVGRKESEEKIKFLACRHPILYVYMTTLNSIWLLKKRHSPVSETTRILLISLPLLSPIPPLKTSSPSLSCVCARHTHSHTHTLSSPTARPHGLQRESIPSCKNSYGVYSIFCSILWVYLILLNSEKHMFNRILKNDIVKSTSIISAFAKTRNYLDLKKHFHIVELQKFLVKLIM